MTKKLTLAYSTCPNDTFIFYALAHGLIDCDIMFDVQLMDIDQLNHHAASGDYDITKLSFAAFDHVRNKYELLNVGAALGRGCGPLIVSKESVDYQSSLSSTFAIPGQWTTANLLLRLYLNKAVKTVTMPFDQIMPSIQKGEVDAGVIIHEGRFIYPKYGLKCQVDLGEWWEKKTSLPIPLGGIAIRKDCLLYAEKVEFAIRESIQFAFKNRTEPMQYIRTYAHEMEDDVIQNHIQLYVNDYSLSLGEDGQQAINQLFKQAQSARI